MLMFLSSLFLFKKDFMFLLFWITFIIGVILYFVGRTSQNVYVGQAPWLLFIFDIGLLGYKVFGFSF
jgi:hypothetical protein